MSSVNPSASHPLVGVYFHRLDNKGKIKNQGVVRGIDGRMVIVTLFSWLDGRATDVCAMKKSVLFSKAFRLYPDREAMDMALRKEQEKARRT